MCIMYPDAKVAFTAGHSYKSKNKPNKHGFIYKNSVEVEGKCTMILPIPTNDESSVEVIDTTAFASMMDEYYDDTKRCRSIGLSSDWEITQCGMYTLAVGRDIQNINSALGVELKPQLSDWLLSHYPEGSFTFISCVWEGDMNAQPIQVEYTPTWEKYLFFPMMEAHGDIPFEGTTKRNHYLTVSTGESASPSFEFQNAPDWLFNSYAGFSLEYKPCLNGDYYIHIEKHQTIWRSDKTNINFKAEPLVIPDLEPTGAVEYFQWRKRQANKVLD
jgi:hypothetical protein